MGRVFFNTRKNIHALDGAYTMLESDSGKTFMLSATGGTVAITLLPAADLVEGVKNGDIIFYDGVAGHDIAYNDELYRVIRMRDIVLVE